MSNALLTPTIIAKEALMQLENNLTLGAIVHRTYREEFVKIGDTVTIRKPVKFVVNDGASLIKQDVEEGNTTIQVNKQKHVAWSFNSKDLTLTIDDFSERYITPAMVQIANKVDSDLFALYSSIWNHVGTPGVPPTSFLDLATAAARLDDMAVPNSDRHALHSPTVGYKLANDVKTTFIQKSGKTLTALEKGTLGEYATFTNVAAQNVARHTVGALGGTPLVNGAAQNTTYAASKTTNTQTLNTKGWSNSITGVVKAGDVITLAGVSAVNPIGRQTLDFLQTFVVTADANSDGSGNAALTIAPAMITSGAYQNVSAAPADGAAITIKTGSAATTYAQSLCLHKNAFALVTVPLIKPDGVNFASSQSHKGLSVRVVKMFDIQNDEDVIRFDVLYGVKAIYPDLACRLTA